MFASEKRWFYGGMILALAVLMVIWVSGRDQSAAGERGPKAHRRSSLIAEVRSVEAKSAVVRHRLPKSKRKASAEPSESEQEPVFDVGGRRFSSLQAAVDAAKDGDTITLAGNAYVRNPVEVRKNLNFNLNGHRLVARNSKLSRKRRMGRYSAGTHAITVFGDKAVTVENGFIEVDANGGDGGFSGAVEIVPDPAEEVAAETPDPVQEPTGDDDRFDVILRDLEVTTDASRDAAFRNAEGKMLIDNCKVGATGGNGSYTIGEGSETTIRDCGFDTTGTGGECSWWNNTIAVAFGGKTIVESGEYVAKMAEGVEGATYGTYVYSSGGTIEVNGGDFQADQVVRADRDAATHSEPIVAEVVVKDGALSGKMTSHAWGEGSEDMAGVSAYGGVFDNAPSEEQVPDGKMVVDYGDGTYSVEESAEKQM